MLPEIGASELIVIAIVALIVVGPKDLPLLMRKVGRFMNRMRGMAAEFRASFDEMARQSELDELRKEVEALRRGQTDDLRSFRTEADDLVHEIDRAARGLDDAPEAPMPGPGHPAFDAASDPLPSHGPVVPTADTPPEAAAAPPPSRPAVDDAEPEPASRRSRRKAG
jgi:sec-independent protein translocase protein TatB